MSDTIVLDDLVFGVRRSARRTLRLTVERDGRLILAAPHDLPFNKIEDFAREKRFWVHTKLAQKEELRRPGVPKQYVSGECFQYLGRNHKLRLVDEIFPRDTAPPLRLYQGVFLLPRRLASEGQSLFRAWYIIHGRPLLAVRVRRFQDRIGVTPQAVDVTDLGFRWASCSPRKRITVNWRVMQLPAGIIDYIVVHELVHLIEPKHDQNFWQRVERVLPDFLERKQWLAENGSDFSA